MERAYTLGKRDMVSLGGSRAGFSETDRALTPGKAGQATAKVRAIDCCAIVHSGGQRSHTAAAERSSHKGSSHTDWGIWGQDAAVM